MKKFVLALAMIAGFVAQQSTSQADECCCSGCGCQCQCQNTCHLVCYTKKVVVDCYGCKCEDFCVPGPSCKGCLHNDKCCPCDQGCSCGCGCDHRPDCHLTWRDWCPGDCADVKTKKVLVHYQTVKEIPSYKWVVEPLCSACSEKCSQQPLPAGAPPAPPAAPPTAGKSAATDMPVAPAGAKLSY